MTKPKNRNAGASALAPAPVERLVTTSSMRTPYAGLELKQHGRREGSMVAFSLPSLMNGLQVARVVRGGV